MVHRKIILTLILCCVSREAASCFFPQEYHGSYVVQYLPTSFNGQASHFSEVTIMVDSIPVWGTCHKRQGNNVLLRDRTKTMECIRCFRLQLHSVNVLQIYTEGLDKCHTTEEAAMTSCPTDDMIRQDRSKEILLYRKPGAESVLQQVFCPINGRFKFTYTMGEIQCSEPVSEISNCPYGFVLNAKFKQCTFGDREVSFQCLGDWDGHSGQKYLALLDPSPPPSAATSAGSGGPRYRCAMYGEKDGQIVVTISPDSTCASLKNHTLNHETFRLTPVVAPSWPVSAQKSQCKFPEWAEGEWQQIRVQGDTLTYTDPHNFQSYTMRCLAQDKVSTTVGDEGTSNYLVYARTQCGDETYNCLTMSYRGKLAMEFQIGQYPSLHYNQSLCSPQQFASRAWIAQGRISSTKRSSCPIAGDYTGLIPDATGLCAKLSSDCNNPETMFYTVSNCETENEIYEERVYRCLGEWEEDGVLYAFTQRKDLQGFQCFVGKIIDGQDVFIKEAGDNCVRGMEPTKFGMKMIKQGSCSTDTLADMPQHASDGELENSEQPDKSITTIMTHGKASPIIPRTTPQSSEPTTTTKTWRPITATPTEGHSASSQISAMKLNLSTAFVTIIILGTSL